MTHVIPKKLFFIWFGNNIPSYAKYCVEQFKQLNTEFECIFIHKSIKEIEDIYFNKKIITIYDKLLFDTINIILNGNNTYNNYILNQKQLYNTNIRFIQLLSDIYRVYLVNVIGGIYLDCDTFPLKPFDQNILFNDFCVAKHFSENIASVDNYFFGFTPKISCNLHTIPIPLQAITTLQLLQTTQFNKLEFEICKYKFFKCQLSLNDFKHISSPFYICHFCKNSWHKKHIINIPYSKLDKLL